MSQQNKDSAVIQEKEEVPEFSMENFIFQKVLLNNSNRKTIFMLGSVFERHAILILEKISFSEGQFNNPSSNLLKKCIIEGLLDNNIYREFFATICDNDFNKLRATVIYPATEKHIIKYTEQKRYVIQESPEDYRSITLPTILEDQFDCTWVYNILEHKKEAERIIIEDLDPETGFILLPDLKWDGVTMETLYVTAIVMNRDIKSIRDLREKHLPLLENIQKKSYKAIKEKYGVESSQLRAYFHYQPSYYHLHVHFNLIDYDAPGIYCDKAHLLNSVIDNIKLMPNYYEKATLTFVARENDQLYQAYKSNL